MAAHFIAWNKTSGKYSSSERETKADPQTDPWTVTVIVTWTSLHNFIRIEPKSKLALSLMLLLPLTQIRTIPLTITQLEPEPQLNPNHATDIKKKNIYFPWT